MAQQFLHGAQVAAAFQQVRGKRVAEQVRVDVHIQPLLLGPGSHAQLHGARGEALATTPDEQWPRRRFFAARQIFVAQSQPSQHGTTRRAADGDDALLTALAGDAHQLLVEVDVAEVQAHQFGQTDAAGVEQLHHGEVARGERGVRRYGRLGRWCQLRRQQAGHTVHIERGGQAPAGLGRTHFQCRVALRQAFALQPAPETAYRRKAPGQRARRQAALVAFRDEFADVRFGEGVRCA